MFWCLRKPTLSPKGTRQKSHVCAVCSEQPRAKFLEESTCASGRLGFRPEAREWDMGMYLLRADTASC
jgi:hypothetical protein